MMKAKDTAEVINEIWTSIEGSYESDQRLIRDAIRNSNMFGATKDEWDISLEATFADSVIVSNSAGKKPVYYKAEWSKDKKGNITFDDVEEVETTVVVKAKNEQRELQAEIRKKTNTVDLNEDILTEITLTEKQVAGKTVYGGRVAVAQRADITNGNAREYMSSALESAIAVVKIRINEHGPLMMDSKHRVKDGKNYRELRETVALVHDANWHPETKTVSLDDIKFVGTEAGKDLVALLEGGARLQVSQRASGSAQLVRDESTGKLKELVDSLVIDGWDFVPSTEASVPDANFEFQVMTEARGGIKEMNEAGARVMTQEEVASLMDTKLEEFKTAIESGKEAEKEGITAAVTEALKSLGVGTEDEEEEGKEGTKPKDEKTKDKDKAKTKAKGKAEDEDEEEEDPKPKVEATEPTPDPEKEELKKKVDELEATVGKSNEQITALTQKDELTELRDISQRLLTEQLSDKAYARFDEPQKKLILESINPDDLYGKVDLENEATINESLKPLVDIEAGKVDAIVATTKLDELNYPVRGEGGEGISHVTVINEHVPNGEYIAKLTEEVEDRMDNLGLWVMPDSHPAIATLDEILAIYDRSNYRRLLNEANEEVKQDDIGVRVASISRVVIAVAYRRLTALTVCDLGTMSNRIEDVMVASWVPVETTDIADDMASIEIAEGDTIPTAGISYSAVPMYATRKAIRTFITSEARATSRGTPMTPEADAVAGLALDVQHRVDRYLWQYMLTAAQMQAYTQVTSYTALTVVGSTLEWDMTNIPGFMQFEILKTVDGNGNPTGHKLGKLYAGPAGNTLQPLEVRTDAPAALTYGTHYTVNWPDGTITLTAAGEIIRGSDGIEAKYTYTTNSQFWSVVPPTGISLYEHLINLRQEVGQAKVVIGNRHYAPNFLSMSLETEDLVTSGPQYTQAGSTPADILDRLNNVVAFAGLTPVKTSAMPQSWILLGVRGSCVHRVHTPWGIRGPITDKDTGDDFFLAEEYSAADVPVKGKLSLVGVQDLNT